VRRAKETVIDLANPKSKKRIRKKNNVLALSRESAQRIWLLLETLIELSLIDVWIVGLWIP
jgi:hypothetical protein